MRVAILILLIMNLLGIGALLKVLIVNRRNRESIRGVTGGLKDSQERLEQAIDNEQGEEQHGNDRQSNH